MNNPLKTFTVVVTSANSNGCIIDVSIYKNVRSGQYAFFEMVANSFPLCTDSNITHLRTQLESLRISATSIPIEITNIQEWIKNLIGESYEKADVMINENKK